MIAIPITVIGFVVLALVLLTFNRRLKRAVQEQTSTAEQLRHSREMLQMYAKQTEQFSLSAASILSIKDEKLLFSRISDAIVNYSDFSRVLISLFYDTAPYRELIGYAGVSDEIVEKVRNTELQKFWYDKVFAEGIRLGQASYYIPHTMKYILNQEATVYGEGEPPAHDEGWHPEDNLFVRMNDENGEFIGVISVDSAKSGLRPTDEIVRPLEIYASLISQIIILKRNQRLREELEDQLRQARKMEAIGNLTGGIAHDFNNILAIIIGNVELAQFMQNNHEPCSAYLAEIHRASHRARDIVRHLLAFSRKTPNELTVVKIGATLEESLSFLRSTLPSTIAIVKNIDLGEALIRANPTQIHQIMLNLCTNAVHAMEDHSGTLTVNADVVDLESFLDIGSKTLPAGRYVEIEVRDTGHGIDEEDMHRIFDPYFTTKEMGKGTGMGLAIVHGIVQGHSGAVTADSKPGEGSTFTVYLPLYEEEYREEEVAPGKVAGGNERILLIDDDAPLLEAQRKRLQRLGYRVEAANCPLRAIELFAADPQGIDLVITDMTMPDMTGDLLAAKLLEMSPNLPIILCTGYSEKIDGTRAIDLGIRRYFEKPVVFDELVGAIRSELKNAAQRLS